MDSRRTDLTDSLIASALTDTNHALWEFGMTTTASPDTGKQPDSAGGAPIGVPATDTETCTLEIGGMWFPPNRGGFRYAASRWGAAVFS